MSGSRLLKAVHVIGYVTTAIVLLEAAAVGYLYWRLWEQDAPVRESTRTHDGPLGRSNRRGGDALDALARVRVRPAEGQDGLNYVRMPAFSTWTAVGIQLPPGATKAEGRMVGVRWNEATGSATFSAVQTFAVPRADYLDAVRQIDTLTDGWPGSGSSSRCYDGVSVAFERIRDRSLTSGGGNAACDAHYAVLMEIMGRLIDRFGAKGPGLIPPAATAAASDEPGTPPSSDGPPGASR
jgi:hypothetical protein